MKWLFSYLSIEVHYIYTEKHSVLVYYIFIFNFNFQKIPRCFTFNIAHNFCAQWAFGVIKTLVITKQSKTQLSHLKITEIGDSNLRMCKFLRLTTISAALYLN